MKGKEPPQFLSTHPSSGTRINDLIVRYFEYNKKDNSNLKLLIIFTIFFVIWSLVFLLQ